MSISDFNPPQKLSPFPHNPVLLAGEADWEGLRGLASTDARCQKHFDRLVELACGLLDQAVLPIEPDKDGRKRMLTPARRLLAHVLLLGFARHLTGDIRFSNRVAAEVEKACARSDWNPSCTPSDPRSEGPLFPLAFWP